MFPQIMQRAGQVLLTFLLLAASTVAMAQRTINGKVSDSNGQPLSGATVLVKGSKTSVMTGNDGSFSILADDKAVLVISSIGFLSREVNAADAASIQLSTDTKDLGEVVVTALGIRKEKETGLCPAGSKRRRPDCSTRKQCSQSAGW